VTDRSDLNICCEKGRKPMNMHHWPLGAIVRELCTNAYDAVIERSYLEWNGKLPTVEVKNAADQIGAYAFFDGALAFSVAITVTYVTKDRDASRKFYTDNLSKLRNNPKKEHIPMLYKVALMVRSFSVLPIDAWVNNYSTKSGKNVPQPLKKALIGGFGMVYC
jgi:hypothetical protein